MTLNDERTLDGAGFTALARMLANRYFKPTVGVCVAVLLLSVGGGVVLDVFAPFNRWVNIGRAAVSLMIGGSLFYCVWAFLYRTATPETVSLRSRFHVSLRRKVSVVLIALTVAVVFIFSNPNPLYCLVSGLSLAMIAAFVIFAMKTSEEEQLDELGIIEDKEFNEIVRKAKRAQQKKAKAEKKAEDEGKGEEQVEPSTDDEDKADTES